MPSPYKKVADMTEEEHEKTRAVGREKARLRRLRRRDELNKYQNELYYKHKELRLKKDKEYYRRNIEIVKQRVKIYTEKNPQVNKKATVRYRTVNGALIAFKAAFGRDINPPQELLELKTQLLEIKRELRNEKC